jgi:hypothetical protein
LNRIATEKQKQDEQNYARLSKRIEVLHLLRTHTREEASLEALTRVATHGHQVGDRVLFCAAQWFGKCVRSSDFLARYGGEEFVVLPDDIGLSQAEVKFTELLGKVAASSYA